MTALLVLARALHFGAGMILVGVVAFRWLILRPALLWTSESQWERFSPFFRRMSLILAFSAAGLLLSTLGLFWITTANMSGTSLSEALDRETMDTVLWQTRFGTICLFRAALVLLLGLLIGPLFRKQWMSRRSGSPLEIICALVAVGLLISNSFAGHAAAASGPALPWRIASDSVHLLATSVWPTGLLFFSLFLAGAVPSAEILAVVRRFSRVSLITVAILIATGLLNTYFLVGNFGALITTPYGHVLAVKLLLLLLILLIAAWNRFRLLPSLFAVAGESTSIGVFQRLRHFVLIELALAAAIVLVVAILGITPPPH